MDVFVLIVFGLLTVFGLGHWRVMWTGQLPRFLRSKSAARGWRWRSGLEQVPVGPTDAAIVLTVSGLFVGAVGLEIAEASGGVAGFGNVVAAVGYSAAGVFGLLAVTIAVFRRPVWLIPPCLRAEPASPADGEDAVKRSPRKKLLVVMVGFVMATLIPLALGVNVGRSLVIGGTYALLFLFLCIVPLPGTVVGTVLAIVLMVLFVPRDPPVSDGLPLHGWEFAWGSSAIGAVLMVSWHGLDMLRRKRR